MAAPHSPGANQCTSNSADGSRCGNWTRSRTKQCGLHRKHGSKKPAKKHVAKKPVAATQLASLKNQANLSAYDAQNRAAKREDVFHDLPSKGAFTVAPGVVLRGEWTHDPDVGGWTFLGALSTAAADGTVAELTWEDGSAELYHGVIAAMCGEDARKSLGVLAVGFGLKSLAAGP